MTMKEFNKYTEKESIFGEYIAAISDYFNCGNIILDNAIYRYLSDVGRKLADNEYWQGREDALAGIAYCKDCKYWYEYVDGNGTLGECSLCYSRFNDRKAGDFCSYGERKENNENRNYKRKL